MVVMVMLVVVMLVVERMPGASPALVPGPSSPHRQERA
jgi:hypothetical protein